MFVDPLDVLAVSEPFPHFRIESVFSDRELLQRLGRWMHESEHWRLQQATWYSYYGFDFASQPLSGTAIELTSPTVVSALVKMCEKVFHERFFEAVVLGAHKLVKDQYMAVHTDSAKDVAHTHRLVVQIPGPEQVAGGDLLLFKSKNSAEHERAYAPIANTGFGFEFNDGSFHAVSPITQGARYSLIINLKASRGLTTEDVFASLPPGYAKRLFWAKEPKLVRSAP